MRLYASAKEGISNTVSRGARVVKNFSAPLATKFTHKMRSGGKGMWGRGPALYKQIIIIFDLRRQCEVQFCEAMILYNPLGLLILTL